MYVPTYVLAMRKGARLPRLRWLSPVGAPNALPSQSLSRVERSSRVLGGEGPRYGDQAQTDGRSVAPSSAVVKRPLAQLMWPT